MDEKKKVELELTIDEAEIIIKAMRNFWNGCGNYVDYDENMFIHSIADRVTKKLEKEFDL